MRRFSRIVVTTLFMSSIVVGGYILSLPVAAVPSSSWQTSAVTVSKLSDYSWANGDQYRYGNNPCVYMDGYNWSTQSNGWNTSRVKSITNQCAVTGSSLYHAYRSVMTFDSSYWQQLDLLTNYPNPNTFANAGTNGMAIITNSYQNYYGAPVELNYIDDVLSTFSMFTKDASGNVVRKPSKPSDHKLTYPDGRTLSLTSTSGISYSPNGKWLYVNVNQVGQLRINTDDFSVLSFASGFMPAQSLYVSIANSGDTIATYSKDKGLKVYDLTACQPEKLNYASRSCVTRDFTAQLRDGLRQTLDNPTLLVDMYPREIKFLNEFTLKVLVGYQYGSEYKTAFMNVALDATEPPTRYLALGDSFSSGEGTFDYVGETNFYTSENEFNLCHLSGVSYPYLLSKVIPSTWFGSVACSGAESFEVVNEKSDINFINKISRARTTNNAETYINDLLSTAVPGYIAQNSNVVSFSPTIATISMGGNDVGFGSIVAACITQPGCFSSRDERERKADEIASKILGMSSKLRTIRESMAGLNPKLYVLGYPKITSTENTLCSLIGYDERLRLDALVEYLNESVKVAAHTARAIFVDASSSFVPLVNEDHRICGNASLAANGFVGAGQARSRQSTVRPGNIFGAESYHPNTLGHELLAATIRRLTNDFQLSSTNGANLSSRPDSTVYQRFVGDMLDNLSVSATYLAMTQYETIQRGNSLELQIKQNAGLLPSSNGKATVELHSEPVVLATVNFNPAVDTALSATIPSNVAPGWHELHLLYTDIEGKSIDLYQYIYVVASQNDYDGDGILNGDETCPVGGALGFDSDNDGIDDACDAQFKEEILPMANADIPEKTQPSTKTDVALSVSPIASSYMATSTPAILQGSGNQETAPLLAVLGQSDDLKVPQISNGISYLEDSDANSSDLYVLVGIVTAIAITIVGIVIKRT